MRLDYNSPEALSPVIEALVFASDEPLSAQELRALILGEEPTKTAIETEARSETLEAGESESIQDADVSPEFDSSSNGETSNGKATQPAVKTRKRRSPIELPIIHQAVELLNASYLLHENVFRIVEIAGGYQFATRPEFADYVARLFKEKSRRRLSGAALESLAIIAYKQPVSKLDVENIRGVNCDEVLKSLLEKNLITITGRAEAIGRPLLYGTTPDFLRHFGLPDLRDLPKPRELEELMKEESIRATTLEEAAFEFVTPQSEDVATDETSVPRHEAHFEDEEQDSNDEFDEEELSGIELDLEALNGSTTEYREMNGNG